MNRDIFIKNLTGDKIEMSPKGRCANELTVEEFEKGYESFFDMIFEIATTDVSSLAGYGEFDENNKAPFAPSRSLSARPLMRIRRATGTTGRRCLRRRFSRRTISTRSTRRSCSMHPTARGKGSLQTTTPSSST